MSHLVYSSNINNITFKVSRREPELIQPARPTPRELKLLSIIDDRPGLHCHPSVFQVYPAAAPASMEDDVVDQRDPAEVIRAALGEVLVYYYPLAGRLREVWPGRKLAVDCTGEGVLFIEADADVRLEELGKEICPPFPCYEELLFDVPGSSAILHSPLILIQITRFQCGGFIFGIQVNHTIIDAEGKSQFLKAVAEIARGVSQPSLLPVWERHLLKARDPPMVTCAHRHYDEDLKSSTVPQAQTICRSFFFGPKEISALRKLIPSHLQVVCSTFDVIIVCLWRCRTIALGYRLDQEVRAVFTVNVRSKLNPPLPVGYYGNAFTVSTVITTAEKLLKNPPGYVLELVRRAKDAITDEYLRSLLDSMVLQGRSMFRMRKSYLVSDVRGLFSELDFGWGRPIYGGHANPKVMSFLTSYKNSQGTKGVLVSVDLPPNVMEKFTVELGMMLKNVEGRLGRWCKDPISAL